MPTEIAAIAEALYAGLPEEFTPARTDAEKAAKKEDRELAASIKALRKPSIGAWAVNQLVRREADQIDQVLTLAQSLRDAAAALDGEELRALTQQRRQLVSALTTRARQLALESGIRLTETVADQVTDTLTAAMLDEGAAAACRTGLLVTTLAATGVDDTDWSAFVALPEAMGTRAKRVDHAGTPALHVVPDNRAVKREAARERLKEAEADVTAAQRAGKNAEKQLRTLNAQQLQIQSRLDELQRQVSVAEEELTILDDQIEDMEAEQTEAAEWLRESTAARDKAKRELDALK